MGQIRIESTREEQLAEIAALHMACWRKNFRGLVDQATLDSLPEEAWLARRRAQFGTGGRIHLVALDEAGRVRGFCDGGASRESRFADHGEVLSLFVAPDGQGGGVGRALFAAMRERLREAGFRKMIVKTFLANPASREFYEKQGCTFAGESSFELGGRAYPEAVYRADLGDAG